ncbi:MAG: flagellar hook-basal body complex protein FliE [Bdellovibrionales bacterium]|nr:flagellar hook-basal body complex protein FliE [Bdellovibrionales bacterium]
MPNNLTIENLSRVVETGDTGAFMGRSQAVTDSMVVREMAKNGMQPSSETSAAGANAKTFSGMLEESLDKVNTYQHQADTAVKELISGRSKNIHETMLTLERADTSLKLAMQVRNKILEAYREIMRMQV